MPGIKKITSKKLLEYLEKLNLISKSDIYGTHNKYFSATGYSKGTERTRYFGYCHELIETMIDRNAMYDEVKKAMLFAYVVLDADKYRLSIIKAKDDLDIQELYNKYVLGGIE